MDALAKWLVYLISAWISVKYADRYVVVGPVFGLAVVAYDSKLFRNISRQKHIAFILASTFIYALVYWISMRRWETESELFNYLLGPFQVGIVFGSILLPYAHKIIFKKPPARTKQVILLLIGSFYLVTSFVYFNNEFGFGIHFNFAAAAIAVWQGVYLYLFFSNQKRKK